MCTSGRFEIGGTWEDPGGVFFRICSRKSFKTRPNSPFGSETSIYSLIQQGVNAKFVLVLKNIQKNLEYTLFFVSSIQYKQSHKYKVTKIY